MATKNVVVVDQPHRKKLLSTLIELRRANHLTDILLKFRKNEISAHRIVLSAASQVFAAMFQINMKEREEGQVDLSSFDFNEIVAEEFVEYMYTGNIYLTEQNVEGLLGCANYFMMSELKKICSEFLERSLVTTNCLGIFAVASRYECLELKEKCWKLIHQRFIEVVDGDEFLELSYPAVINMLSGDHIEVPNEDVVFFSFIRWLQHDWKDRSKYFQGLFECVRIPYLSEECINILKSKFYESVLKKDVITRKLCFDNNGNNIYYEDMKNFPRQCLDTSAVIMTTGGYDGNNCLMSSFAFSLNNSKWAHLAPMQISRHDHGTASLGNNIFVAGGFNSRSGPLSSAEHYNSIQNKWKEIPSMNSKRKSLGICTYQGKLFVSGGLDENYNALETVEYFDDEQSAWILFTPMNQPRYNHGFVANNDHGIFSIGGWKTMTAERFSDGEWSMISSMSSCRAGATSVIQNDKIYVFGGYSEYQCISTIEIYNIKENIWISGASGSIARWRAGCAMSDNLIYVIGGRDSSWQYLDAVETYNIEKDEWNFETSLPCKMMGVRCSVVKIPKNTIHQVVICFSSLCLLKHDDEVQRRSQTVCKIIGVE